MKQPDTSRLDGTRNPNGPIAWIATILIALPTFVVVSLGSVLLIVFANTFHLPFLYPIEHSAWAQPLLTIFASGMSGFLGAGAVYYVLKNSLKAYPPGVAFACVLALPLSYIPLGIYFGHTETQHWLEVAAVVAATFVTGKSLYLNQTD